jgi:photosystem II stability/assembly factor-like uncharacterized protein
MKKHLQFFLISLLLTSSLSFAQDLSNWEWLHQKPQGNTLRWVKVWDANNWYAVGYGNTFMKTSDAGNNWYVSNTAGKTSSTLALSSLYSAWFFNKDTGIVVGSNNSVLITNNAGATFDTIPGFPVSNATYYNIYFQSRLIGWICGGTAGARLFQTTDGGLTWSANLNFPVATANDIWSPDGITILACLSSGRVARSTDAGISWTTIAVTNFALNKMCFWNSTTGMVVGGAGTVKLTTDAGVTWTNANTSLTVGSTFYGVNYNHGTIYLSGTISPTSAPNPIYISTNLGVSWDTLNISQSQIVPASYYGIDVNSNVAVFAGQHGQINSLIGNTITSYTSNYKTGMINDIWANGLGKIVTAGGGSQVGNTNDQMMYSLDSGKTFQIASMNPTTSSIMRSLKMVNENIGYVAGDFGAVYKTTDGGVNWLKLTTPAPSGHGLRVDFIDANTGWVFSFTGITGASQMWKTTNGGSTWTTQSFSTSIVDDNKIRNSCMVNANYGWVLTNKYPWKTTDGGETWIQQYYQNDYSSNGYQIQMFDTLKGYISTSSGGRIHRTTDGGASWDSLYSSSYGALWSGMVWKDFNVGMVAGHNNTWLTTDAGATWNYQLLGGNTYYNLFCTVTDVTTFYVVGGGGDIHRWSDFVVPVELTSVTASVKESNVTLLWKTSTEVNNKGFSIERKSFNDEFKTIGFVKGNGTTTNISTYSFTDMNVPNGNYNYRLLQIDYDGTSKYYNVPEDITVNLSQFILAQNYPNPFNPATYISYGLPFESEVKLEIFDITGQRITFLVNEVQNAGYYKVVLQRDDLSSGVYFYMINAQEKNGSRSFRSVKKMILLK